MSSLNRFNKRRIYFRKRVDREIEVSIGVEVEIEDHEVDPADQNRTRYIRADVRREVYDRAATLITDTWLPANRSDV